MTLDNNLVGREEALEFCRHLLLKKNKKKEWFIRDDYRELAECTMTLLGESPPSGKMMWKKPGACHKARFMAFGIYIMKSLAFSKQLEVMLVVELLVVAVFKMLEEEALNELAETD